MFRRGRFGLRFPQPVPGSARIEYGRGGRYGLQMLPGLAPTRSPVGLDYTSAVYGGTSTTAAATVRSAVQQHAINGCRFWLQ